jgi:hypothetical protein
MSLIIGGVIGSSVVLIGDSATGIKVARMPSLNLLVGWVGYFNKSPYWLFSSGSAEYMDPKVVAQDFNESAKLVISTCRMHGAAILPVQVATPKHPLLRVKDAFNHWN